jgi:hypothetical protein
MLRKRSTKRHSIIPGVLNFAKTHRLLMTLSTCDDQIIFTSHLYSETQGIASICHPPETHPLDPTP